MKKDYAKYLPKKSKTNVLKRFILPLIIVAFIIFAAFIGYNYHEQGSYTKWMHHLKSLYTHQTIKTNPIPPKKIVTIKPSEPEVQFHFYTELPAMQVTLPITDNTPPPALVKKNSEKSTKNQYILQLGVYSNETAASQMRLSLMIEGFEADVVKSVSKNHTVYRIQQGPFATLAEATVLQEKLKNQGIAAMVKKII